eukprot:PhF_6_TR42674/c0_g1_i2/m.64340
MGILHSKTLSPVETLVRSLRANASDPHASCFCMKEIQKLIDQDQPENSVKATFVELLCREDCNGFRLLFRNALLMRNADIKSHTLLWATYAVERQPDVIPKFIHEMGILAFLADYYTSVSGGIGYIVSANLLLR